MTYAGTDYCSLVELKAQLRIADTVDDTALATYITSASRAIDAECYRTFGLTGSAVARLFDYDGLHIEGRCAVKLADLQTTVGLAVTADYGYDYTYSTTLVLNTDFDLWPWNAAADGVPWTHLVLRPYITTPSPTCAPQARLFSVTGNWGWTAVPTLVKSACLIQAARFFVRRDAPFGIAGSPDSGSEMRLLASLDPDVALMLAPLVRLWGAA